MKKLIFIIPILTLVFAVVMWYILPDVVPTHFGVSGDVDAYGSKNLLFVIPFVSFAFIVFSKTESSKNQIIYVLSMTFLFYIEILMGLSMKNPNQDIIGLIFIGFGLLLFITGFVLPLSSVSWSVGIRTKWTVSDKNVWKRTHEFARYIFIFSGILIILSALLLDGSVRFVVSLIIAILSVLIPAVYSYFISNNKV